MKKLIKELTPVEIDAVCEKQNPVKLGGRACIKCPLRWGKQCLACQPPIITKLLYQRIIKTIGDNTVEV